MKIATKISSLIKLLIIDYELCVSEYGLSIRCVVKWRSNHHLEPQHQKWAGYLHHQGNGSEANCRNFQRWRSSLSLVLTIWPKLFISSYVTLAKGQSGSVLTGGSDRQLRSGKQQHSPLGFGDYQWQLVAMAGYKILWFFLFYSALPFCLCSAFLCSTRLVLQFLNCVLFSLYSCSHFPYDCLFKNNLHVCTISSIIPRPLPILFEKWVFYSMWGWPAKQYDPINPKFARPRSKLTLFSKAILLKIICNMFWN